MLAIAPLEAKAADFVVWWDEAYYAEEDAALRETIAAFEKDTGKQVELVVHPMEELPGKSLLEQAGFSLEDIPREWKHVGPSGAMRCSPPCARPPGATTSGA